MNQCVSRCSVSVRDFGIVLYGFVKQSDAHLRVLFPIAMIRGKVGDPAVLSLLSW